MKIIFVIFIAMAVICIVNVTASSIADGTNALVTFGEQTVEGGDHNETSSKRTEVEGGEVKKPSGESKKCECKCEGVAHDDKKKEGNNSHHNHHQNGTNSGPDHSDYE